MHKLIELRALRHAEYQGYLTKVCNIIVLILVVTLMLSYFLHY
jgi:hypothetical protein